jgi:hypothetical protein
VHMHFVVFRWWSLCPFVGTGGGRAGPGGLVHGVDVLDPHQSSSCTPFGSLPDKVEVH